MYKLLVSVAVSNGNISRVDSRRLLTAGVRVGSRLSLCGIYGGQSVFGIYISPSTSVFACHYHSAVLYTHLIQLPPTLYNRGS